MKKIIGILLASSVLSSAAFANAAPSACPACPSAPAAKWGGFKLGAQLGYGHSSFSFVDDNVRSDISLKGAIGGLHAGYDYQVSNSVLLGLNTSFDLSGVKGTLQDAKISNKWTVAIVPRVGLVLQDSMLYAGAGWAATKFQLKDTDAATPLKGKKTLNAFRLQMGAAQRMNKVLVGVEANYDFYGKKKFVADIDNSSFKPRTLSAMVKVSYMM